MLVPYLGGWGGGFCSGSPGSASCRGSVKLLGSTGRPLHVLLREKTGTPNPLPVGLFLDFFFPHLDCFSTSVCTNRHEGLSGVPDFTLQRSASLILPKRFCQQPAMPSGTESPARRPGAPFTSEPAKLLPHMTGGVGIRTRFHVAVLRFCKSRNKETEGELCPPSV